MTPPEHIPTDPHEVACNKLLGNISDLLQEGGIPGGGMVAAYVTVVETMTPEGGSNVYLLWSDPRTTVMLGLLSAAEKQVTKHMDL